VQENPADPGQKSQAPPPAAAVQRPEDGMLQVSGLGGVHRALGAGDAVAVIYQARFAAGRADFGEKQHDKQQYNQTLPKKSPV
jgi:hypothetical protein